MNASNNVNILLFAAGLGTRLRPYTYENPKPSIPLFSHPLGYYSIPYLSSLNFNKLLVNTFHLPEKIHALYKKLPLNVDFSDETDFIKGSAGGLLQASDKMTLSAPILLANADEVFFAENPLFLKDALKQHNKNKNYATLVVTKNPQVGKKFGGIWCEPNSNKVINISKLADPNRNLIGWHYIGLLFIDSQVLTEIPLNTESNIFYDVLIKKLPHEKVEIFPISCDWYEVGSFDDYVEAKKQINLKKNDPIYQFLFSALKSFPKSDLADLA